MRHIPVDSYGSCLHNKKSVQYNGEIYSTGSRRDFVKNSFGQLIGKYKVSKRIIYYFAHLNLITCVAPSLLMLRLL